MTLLESQLLDYLLIWVRAGLGSFEYWIVHYLIVHVFQELDIPVSSTAIITIDQYQQWHTNKKIIKNFISVSLKKFFLISSMNE